jgi:protoporphyrinogen oxidase
MKIAIIGAGLGGLACALECEKLGVIPDVFERDESVGWPYTCIIHWLHVVHTSKGDLYEYLKSFGFDIKPKTGETRFFYIYSCCKKLKKKP